MARPLRVKRLDSPLARNGVVAMEPVGAGEEPAAASSDADPVADGVTSVAPLAPPGQAGREGGSPPGTPQRLTTPPPLEEPLEFVSGRVPASLAQRLNAMTLALRQRQPTRASQKGLPQQEVLAVILWALGDPDDAEAVDGLVDLHARYRAARYAAAAEKLGGSV